MRQVMQGRRGFDLGPETPSLNRGALRHDHITIPELITDANCNVDDHDIPSSSATGICRRQPGTEAMLYWHQQGEPQRATAILNFDNISLGCL